MHGKCLRVSWVRLDGAGVGCGDGWVNRVRLASDRDSTNCWQRSSPSFLLNEWRVPQKNVLYTHARSHCACPSGRWASRLIKTSDGKIERQLFAPVI